MQHGTQNDQHDPAPYLSLVEETHSELERSDPADHPDIARDLAVMVWAKLVCDPIPAVRVDAVNVATTMLETAVDKLREVDESSYLPVVRQTLNTLAGLVTRLGDGIEAATGDPHDEGGE